MSEESAGRDPRAVCWISLEHTSKIGSGTERTGQEMPVRDAPVNVLGLVVDRLRSGQSKGECHRSLVLFPK